MTDFFKTPEECSAFRRTNTNPRYRNFYQVHFTAGDEEQFENKRDKTNSDKPKTNPNIPSPYSFDIWDGHSKLTADVTLDTFRYIFNKLKKGIFIKIQDGELKTFLPFSKAKFVNEWSHLIRVHPKYKNVNEFFRHINNMEGRPFSENRVNKFANTWYANGGMFRYEFPIGEGDTGVGHIRDMFRELCENRELPDIEFFINRRDFPLLKRDRTEPYELMFGNESLPLLSHRYEKYSPILSSVFGDGYADIAIPTIDDWSRVRSKDGAFFLKMCRDFSDEFSTPWSEKKATAVFRGASTGMGIDLNTNMRLKAAAMSDGDLLDAGITSWNLRPRRVKNSPYIQTIEKDELPFGLVDKLSYVEQSKYKYILNIDGHVSAFRLSLELAMGSVVLIVDSRWSLWFKQLLKPHVHYIPIKSDLSDLFEKIMWCRENDKKCEEIAKNARKFYEEYLDKKGILDYLQKLLWDLKEVTGDYKTVKSPLEIQLEEERKLVFREEKHTTRDLELIKDIPFDRCYNTLNVVEKLLPRVKGERVKGDGMEEWKVCDNLSIVIKKTNKTNEMIHERFISMNATNHLLKHIPNFAYNFQFSNSEMLVEKIEGETFESYLRGSSFNVREFIFILLQISLALEVAQKHYSFVHYDLFPWNVIIKREKNKRCFEYITEGGRVTRVETNVVPVLIDFGKSRAVIDEKIYGYINPYHFSMVQDILSLTLSSLNIVVSEHTLKKEDQMVLLELFNFFTGTTYLPKPITQYHEMKKYVYEKGRFTTLISSDLGTAERITPYQFFTTFSKSYGEFSERKSASLAFNKGNVTQIRDFVIAKSEDEKVLSFINFFFRFMDKKTIVTEYDFIRDYMCITLFHAIETTYILFVKYLKEAERDTSKYLNIYLSCLKKIETWRNIKTKTLQPIPSLPKVEYTLKDFQNREKIEKIVIPDSLPENVSEYREMIDIIHAYEGLGKYVGTYNVKERIALIKTLLFFK